MNTLQSALRTHWQEYLIEFWGLGMFMLNACLAGIILEYPASPVRQVMPSDLARRAVFGLAMGLTIIGIIYSPWGKRSGAHINPAVTLTFLRIGKIAPADALFYILAQFSGGLAGVVIVALALPRQIMHPKVNYVVTVPGTSGVLVAFLAEVTISFLLMFTVLTISNLPKIKNLLGVIMGVLVTLYITFESPFSGMSMNPARTLGSAIPAQVTTALWIYFVAPPVAMLLAAEIYRRWKQPEACAKMCHSGDSGCLFCAYKSQKEKAIA